MLLNGINQINGIKRISVFPLLRLVFAFGYKLIVFGNAFSYGLPIFRRIELQTTEKLSDGVKFDNSFTPMTVINVIGRSFAALPHGLGSTDDLLYCIVPCLSEFLEREQTKARQCSDLEKFCLLSGLRVIILLIDKTSRI